MTFYRPDEEEIKCSSWEALRRHIADCHAEIDRLQSRCEQIESLHRDAERSASLAFEGDGAILPNFGRVGESKVRLVVRLAEAYRDLLAKVEFGKPYKITIDDIETWHNLPVLVPVGLIPEGRTPCEVRSYALQYPHEWIDDNRQLAPATTSKNLAQAGTLNILLADKPAPQFEVGKCYKNRRGELRGPLKQTPKHHSYVKTHPLFFRGWTWTLDGICHDDGKTIDDDSLAPGAVDPPPTWVPWPWLPDGEYRGHHGFVSGAGVCMNTTYAASLRGYTSDPALGRWQVTNGTATWLGE